MEDKCKDKCNRTDHLANERTFLAWIRTNFGIMAFGFVIERFSFFIKQMEVSFGGCATSLTSQKYSSALGIFLITVGTILCVFAFLKFKRTERQINENIYKPSFLLDALLLGLIFFSGFFLVIYLVFSLYPRESV